MQRGNWFIQPRSVHVSGIHIGLLATCCSSKSIKWLLFFSCGFRMLYSCMSLFRWYNLVRICIACLFTSYICLLLCASEILINSYLPFHYWMPCDKSCSICKRKLNRLYECTIAHEMRCKQCIRDNNHTHFTEKQLKQQVLSQPSVTTS
jgi:hypothetical protein